jgi:phosphate starvation-inducible PhoH-like protein
VGDAVTRRFDLAGIDQLRLFGRNDANLRLIREKFGIKITARGQDVVVEGDKHAVKTASKILKDLMESARKGVAVSHRA